MARSIHRGQETGNRGQGVRNRGPWRLKRPARSLLRPLVESLERRDLLASYTTPEDTPFAVSDSSMANAVIVTNPAHGHVFLSNTGGFLYSPTLNYNGPDAFVYRIGGDTTPPQDSTTV